MEVMQTQGIINIIQSMQMMIERWNVHFFKVFIEILKQWATR